MRGQAVETLVGFAVLLVAGAFLIYGLGASGGSSVGGKTLKIEFPQVVGLNVGSDVKVAGVTIGAVRAIDYDVLTTYPVVTITVPRDFPVPRDTSVKLRADGLLGGQHLQITPGGDEQLLSDGDTLPELGQGSVDVVQILADFVAQGVQSQGAGD